MPGLAGPVLRKAERELIAPFAEDFGTGLSLRRREDGGGELPEDVRFEVPACRRRGQPGRPRQPKRPGADLYTFDLPDDFMGPQNFARDRVHVEPFGACVLVRAASLPAGRERHADFIFDVGRAFEEGPRCFALEAAVRRHCPAGRVTADESRELTFRLGAGDADGRASKQRQDKDRTSHTSHSIPPRLEPDITVQNPHQVMSRRAFIDSGGGTQPPPRGL